jgi:hypothetical protein
MGDRDSGREKRVTLTTKGERFLLNMTTEGRTFTQKLLDGMPQPEIREMVQLMQKAITVFEREGAGRNSAAFKNARRKAPKSARVMPPHH